eukprot:73252-Prorocentrum_lima.AAC.1
MLRHSRSRDMSSSMKLRSPSPKLWGVNGLHVKRAFVATTRDAAIAHVFAKHTMLLAEFVGPSSIMPPA